MNHKNVLHLMQEIGSRSRNVGKESLWLDRLPDAVLLKISYNVIYMRITPINNG